MATFEQCLATPLEAMKRITWFTNPHEHRNHLLKHGLMKLHRADQIKFIVRDSAALRSYDISPTLKHHVHRHTTLLLYEDNKTRKWILVDSEDSFVCLCPLITEVDLYFCAGYNSDFFERKTFIQPYSWQTEEDIAEYRTKIQDLIHQFGDHFHKVRKFVPIGPDSSYPDRHRSWIEQKALNLEDKTYRYLLNQRNWIAEFKMFEQRNDQIAKLRNSHLEYDVVLSDTLWGWPHHRYRLHQKLKELSSSYKIYSSLKWNGAAESSGLEKEQFPFITNPIKDNYEKMISASRLAVFATGFHWGWRNIMTLALSIGVPIYMDKPILEPYFSLDEFKIYYNTDQWQSLEQYLQNLNQASWENTKRYNQKLYDQFMSPQKVAKYFIDCVASEMV